jgi:hypothetical protein
MTTYQPPPTPVQIAAARLEQSYRDMLNYFETFPNSPGLGSLSAASEGGIRGSFGLTVSGPDGVSYGAYQISTHQGTMGNFINGFCFSYYPEVYAILKPYEKYAEDKNFASANIAATTKAVRAAGLDIWDTSPDNTLAIQAIDTQVRAQMLSQASPFIKAWWAAVGMVYPPRILKGPPPSTYTFSFFNVQHNFIFLTHYAAVFSLIPGGVKLTAMLSPLFQNVIWSLAVNGGPARSSKIFNPAYKQGMPLHNYVAAVYDRKIARQQGLPDRALAASVVGRFAAEKALVLPQLEAMVML